jgi:hypothetical protein
VLDQSDGGPFYHQLFSGLRDVVNKHADAYVTLYNESLDLSRFKGGAYEETLKRYVKEKYQDKEITRLWRSAPARPDLCSGGATNCGREFPSFSRCSTN